MMLSAKLHLGASLCLIVPMDAVLFSRHYSIQKGVLIDTRKTLTYYRSTQQSNRKMSRPAPQPLFVIKDLVADHGNNNKFLTFKVECQEQPPAQGRPCFVWRLLGRGGGGGGHNPIIYDPHWFQKVRLKQLLSQVLRANGEPEVTPFFRAAMVMRASCEFYFSRPISHCTADGLIRAAAPTHSFVNDLGNMVKFIQDACEGVLYPNDSHIVGTMAMKEYIPHGDSCARGPGGYILVSIQGMNCRRK